MPNRELYHPQPRLDVEQTNYYHLHTGDSEPQVPAVASERDREYLLPMVQEFVSRTGEKRSHHDVAPSPELAQCVTKAREFVEQLTGVSVADIEPVVTTERDGNYSAHFSSIENKFRMHDDIDSLVDRGRDNQAARDQLTALAVHELMHATGRGNLKLVGLEAEDTGVYPQVNSGFTGYDFHHDAMHRFVDTDGESPLVTNQFFEEAAAEEAAARWRETHVDAIEDAPRQRVAIDGHSPLERRFVEASQTDVDIVGGFSYASASYCAQALNRLSDYTGVDLFGLIVESRDPAREADARRQLIRTVNSVEPGLYAQLRQVQYGVEAFAAAHDLVERAIERSSARRLGAVAVTEEYADA